VTVLGPGSNCIDERAYLLALFQSSDRLAVLLRNSSRPTTIQRITTRTKILEPAFQEWLRFKNEREGFDVYIGMNSLKPDSHTRTKDDILEIRHLYLDLDSDGPNALVRIQQSDLVPMPTYILNTSPDRFQVVWRVKDVAQEQAETLLRAMARKFGADPAATDSTRVLRIPGFRNTKCHPEFVVKAQQHSDRVSHSLDFKVQIEYDDGPQRTPERASVRNDNLDSRSLSQSERDWAFAKRALARGDDPENVIRRIADFRSDEKHDPEYYARHTVAKAQAELTSETASSQVKVCNQDLRIP
jgi:RepB DNA-primase from phage plasmid